MRTGQQVRAAPFEWTAEKIVLDDIEFVRIRRGPYWLGDFARVVDIPHDVPLHQLVIKEETSWRR